MPEPIAFPKTHRLKIDRQFWAALIAGLKTSTVRMDRNDIVEGDTIIFQLSADDAAGDPVYRAHNVEVPHVFYDPDGKFLAPGQTEICFK